MSSAPVSSRRHHGSSCVLLLVKDCIPCLWSCVGSLYPVGVRSRSSRTGCTGTRNAGIRTDSAFHAQGARHTRGVDWRETRVCHVTPVSPHTCQRIRFSNIQTGQSFNVSNSRWSANTHSERLMRSTVGRTVCMMICPAESRNQRNRDRSIWPPIRLHSSAFGSPTARSRRSP